MNKSIYYRLEIKRKLKLIPTLLIGTVILTLIIGIVVFCAGKMLYRQNSDMEKKEIIFTSKDNSKLSRTIIAALSQSESITTACNVIELDSDEAMDGVNKPNRIATIIIPAKFLHNLMSGNNLPISIYYSSTQSLYTLIVAELSKAAEASIKCAQSGAFVMVDYYREHNVSDTVIDEDVEELDMIYLARAFTREDFFRRNLITATGNLSVKNYYIASGIMLVLLLLGCIFILKIKDVTTIFSLKLKQNGISSVTQVMASIISIFFVMYLFLFLAMLSLFIAGKYIDFDFKMNLINVIVNTAIASFFSACIITLICDFISGKYTAILLYFILVFASGFASGAFIPSMLLPESLEKIADYLPTTYLQNVIGSILVGEYFTSDIKIIAIYGIVFILLSITFTEIHYAILKQFGKRGDF